MDPCLDDFITLAKELDKLDKHVYLDVLPNLCHGFLNMSLVRSDKWCYNIFPSLKIEITFNN